jgi:hypothetical protein
MDVRSAGLEHKLKKRALAEIYLAKAPFFNLGFEIADGTGILSTEPCVVAGTILRKCSLCVAVAWTLSDSRRLAHLVSGWSFV